jgi:YVTN family beta-propeller protein
MLPATNVERHAESRLPRLRILGALVLSLVVVLPIVAIAGGGGTTGGSHDPAFAPRLAAASAGPKTSATSIGSVVRTLDLFNDTVFAGNSSATTDWYPHSVVYDPDNRTAWVGGGAVNLMGVEVVDPADDLGVRVLPGGQVSALAYDNVTNAMWVTGGASGFTNYVTVYNASTYTVEETLGTGDTPTSLAFDWKTNAMYVTNFGSDNVSVFDGTNYTALGSVAVGETPTSIVYDPNNDKLYVCNEDSANITAFNQTPPRSPISIPTDPPQPGTPYWLLYDPTNSELYVNDLGDGGLGLINTTSSPEADVGPIALPSGCGGYYEDGMALVPGGALYVACEQLGELVEYSPAPTTSPTTYTAVIPIAPEAGTEGLAYDGALGRILAVSSNPAYEASTNLTEISTSDNSLVGTVPLENLPLGLASGGGHGVLYVYDGNTGTLDVLNQQTMVVERSVFVGYTGAHVVPLSGSVAYDVADGTIYVDFIQDYGKTSGIAAVNSSTFVVTYLPSEYFSDPSGLLYDPLDNRVFVADFGSDQVGAFTPGTSGPPVNISVGGSPVGLALDTADDSVYVTNWDSSNVSVIDASTLANTHTIAVGAEPVGITYDPENQDLYVADSDEYYLTIVNGTRNATQGTIDVGFSGHPEFVAYDSANETVFVTEPESSFGVGSSQLVLVNATNQTLFETQTFGQSLNDVIWDTDTETAFLSGTLPGTVYEYGVLSSSPPPTITAQLSAVPSTVQVAEATSLETAVTGATGALTYQYSTLPPGCASANLATLTCTPTATGTFYVGVNVTQAGGGAAAAVTELAVTARSGPLAVSLAANPPTIRLGASTNITASASGGTLPLTYAYSALPPGCTSENGASFECTPLVTGTFVIGVNVTDAAGTTVSATATLNVTEGLSVTLTATPSSVDLGNASTLEATVSGSHSGGLTYHYTELPPGCTSENAAQLVCTPTAAGSFTPRVEVNDSAGHFANASTSLNVTKSSSSPANTNSSSSGWLWVLLGIVVAILVIVVLLVRRRKKGPDTSGSTSPASDSTPRSPDEAVGLPPS